MAYLTSVKPIIPKRYDRKFISEQVDPLNVVLNDSRVITTYNGREICNVPVSDKYQIFQFDDFVKRMLPIIEGYFTPTRYVMDIFGGIQEIKLYGNSFDVDGDTYYEMMSILNSSDKSRALQINIGLLRQICTNGMVISYEDNHVSIKAKHFKKSLPEKVDYFSTKLKEFKMMSQSQIEFIKKINKHDPVSFLNIAETLMTTEDKKTKKKKISALGKKRVSNFTDMLRSSPTDKMKINEYRDKLHLLTRTASFINKGLTNTDKDLLINAKTAFNCYIESYKKSDSSVLKTECDNILQFIN